MDVEETSTTVCRLLGFPFPKWQWLSPEAWSCWWIRGIWIMKLLFLFLNACYEPNTVQNILHRVIIHRIIAPIVFLGMGRWRLGITVTPVSRWGRTWATRWLDSSPAHLTQMTTLVIILLLVEEFRNGGWEDGRLGWWWLPSGKKWEGPLSLSFRASRWSLFPSVNFSQGLLWKQLPPNCSHGIFRYRSWQPSIRITSHFSFPLCF